eukprot:1151965-Pelagomonas_calceolata.AAC.1
MGGHHSQVQQHHTDQGSWRDSGLRVPGGPANEQPAPAASRQHLPAATRDHRHSAKRMQLNGGEALFWHGSARIDHRHFAKGKQLNGGGKRCLSCMLVRPTIHNCGHSAKCMQRDGGDKRSFCMALHPVAAAAAAAACTAFSRHTKLSSEALTSEHDRKFRRHCFPRTCNHLRRYLASVHMALQGYTSIVPVFEWRDIVIRASSLAAEKRQQRKRKPAPIDGNSSTGNSNSNNANTSNSSSSSSSLSAGSTASSSARGSGRGSAAELNGGGANTAPNALDDSYHTGNASPSGNHEKKSSAQSSSLSRASNAYSTSASNSSESVGQPPQGGQLAEGIMRAFQGTSPSLIGDMWLAAGTP